MTPTREQFKEFIAAVKKAQQKEENLNKAFELIWDDDQGQYPPFYISPLWDAINKAFNFMFGLEDDEYVGNELSWWLEEAPQNEAKCWVDDKDYNVSDVDAFYDFLVEFLGIRGKKRKMNKKRNHRHEERYYLTPKACLMKSLSDTNISDVDRYLKNGIVRSQEFVEKRHLIIQK